jgi:hypothetical protein
MFRNSYVTGHLCHEIATWPRGPVLIDGPQSSSKLKKARGEATALFLLALSGTGDAPPDREPQTPTKELDTGQVTAVGFGSKNVEIRTELEKRVPGYSMPCRANRFEPMGMKSELLGAVLPVLPSDPS